MPADRAAFIRESVATKAIGRCFWGIARLEVVRL